MNTVRTSSWQRLFLRTFIGLTVTAIVALALLIGVIRVLLLQVPEQRSRVELFASVLIGVPVEIEAMDVRWRWRGPELRLSNVRLRDRDAPPALSLGEVRIGVRLWHWLRTREWVAKRVLVDKVSANLRLDAERNLWWMDRELWSWSRPPETFLPGVALPIDLEHMEWRIAPAELTIYDQLAKRNWVFSQVTVNVQRQRNTLVSNVHIPLPSGLGQLLEVTMRYDIAGDSPAIWNVIARGTGLDFSAWQIIWPKAKRWIPRAHGDLTLTLGGELTQVQHVVVQAHLSDVLMANNDANPSVQWQAEQLRGQFAWQHTDQGWHFDASEIELTRAGKSWTQAGDFSLDWKPPLTNYEGQEAQGMGGGSVLETSTSFLPLDDVLPALKLLSVESWSLWLTPLIQAQLEGELSNAQARFIWDSEGTLTSFSSRGEFQHAGGQWGARPTRLSGASGRWQCDQTTGELELLPASSLVVRADSWSDRSMALGSVVGRWRWHRDAGGWAFETSDTTISSDTLKARLVARVTRPKEQASFIDSHLSVESFAIESFLNVLPQYHWNPKLLAWFNTALLGGTAEGEVGFAGLLNQSPFAEGSNLELNMQVMGASFQPAVGWPVATELNGRVQLRGTEFFADGFSGETLGLSFSGARSRIADVRNSIVETRVAEINGPLPAFKSYILTSPLQARTGGRLDHLEVIGKASAELSFDIPVRDLSKTTAQANLLFSDAQFSDSAWPVVVEQVNGAVRYNDGSWDGRDLVAVVLGEPVKVEVFPVLGNASEIPLGIAKGAQTAIRFTGDFASSRWQPVIPMMSEFMSGKSQWQGTLVMPRLESRVGMVQFFMQSDLENTAVTLPTPLAKTANSKESWRLRLDFASKTQIEGDLQWGKKLRGRFDWRQSEEKKKSGWLLYRGTLELSEDIPRLRPFPGLVVNGSAEAVDISEWWSIFNGRPLLGTLQSANLRVTTARVLGWPLREVKVQVNRGAQEWLVQIDSSELAGAIFLPFTLLSGNPITANLDRFYWQSSGAEIASDFDPARLPPMRLEVRDFRFKEIKAGNLFAQLVPVEGGVRIAPFSTASPNLEMQGEVTWRKDRSGDHSELNVQMKSTDAKAAISDLGFQPSLKADHADVRLRLQWDDSLRLKNTASLNGDIALSVYNGQLFEVDPGPGKILGLFSFASLPRRLALDFRDVFDRGLGFDRIEGDFKIENGIATTNNFILESPAGLAAMFGQVDLVKREYNQTAVVQASVGSALPVAGLVAGGPLVGGALLMFSEIFKRPLQELSAVTYRITGNFDNPKIERVAAGT